MNYDNSFVVTITVTCYLWAPSSGDHLFACGAISRPPHSVEHTPILPICIAILMKNVVSVARFFDLFFEPKTLCQCLRNMVHRSGMSVCLKLINHLFKITASYCREILSHLITASKAP